MINDLGAEYLIEQIESAGYSAYYVGGCVRNALLGQPIYDYDLCTSATPENLINIFSNYKLILTGVKHGTVGVCYNSQIYEITTFRIDEEYADSRHPNGVAFTADIHTDLSRRDFTINAMAYNKNIGIIDDFGGIYDAHNKILKAVNDPFKRFQEDALRILRGLRFASVYGFTIESNTANAMIKNKDLLIKISAERILSELTKTLLGQGAEQILTEFLPVLFVVIPELKNSNETAYYKAISLLPYDFALRFATLILPCAKNNLQIEKRLRFDNLTIKKINVLHENYSFNSFYDKCEIKRLMMKLQDLVFDYITWRRAVALAFNQVDLVKDLDFMEQICKDVLNANECYCLKDLNVDGDDLIHLGYHGEQIKIQLEKLLNAVIDGYVRNDKEELLKYLTING